MFHPHRHDTHKSTPYRPECEKGFPASHGSGALVVSASLRCPRVTTTLRRNSRAQGANSTGFWLTELLLLACIAGAAGDSWVQEANYFLPDTVVPLSGKRSLRRYHTVVVESEEHVGRLIWARSEKSVKASLTLQERGGGRNRKKKRKRLVVIVPATWKFIKRAERFRDETTKGEACELLANWDFVSLIGYAGLHFNEDVEPIPKVDERTFCPYLPYIREMAEESLRQISHALERLTVHQSAAVWSRHVKTPDIFKPDTRDQELKQWNDWKFSFVNYVKSIEPSMVDSMKMVGENLNADYNFEDMTDATKSMAVRLYAVLISYLRNRPLKLIRHIKSENGFEAWQRLLKEMQPATRARALALLTQLSRVQFAEGKTISEQLPQYETIITEYERISGQTYADDAKVASILQAVPPHLRAHLQLWIQEDTKYEQVKNKVMELEALSTRWDSSNSLSLPTRIGMDEATPMEVDYIRGDKGKKGGKGKSKDQKGKTKGKEKGKAKTDGKGSWRSGDKGKSQWEKGGFGKKGKAPEKGTKGKAGVCHNCGKTGHFARECWAPKRAQVSQVEEQLPTGVNPGGASSSSQGGQTVSTSSVKMVRLETPPESRSLEIFDLTTPRGSDETAMPPWRVGVIRVELIENDTRDATEVWSGDEEFLDCIEPVVLVPDGIAVVAMDLQDNNEEKMVQMVRRTNEEEHTSCLVTLDSGADVSVLPKSYASVGRWSEGSKNLKMVDAQGKKIEHDGITKARIRTTDTNGKQVELVEEFVLGNVQHPILCAGKLLRKGWSITSAGDSLSLQHEERQVSVPICNERNSLQLEAYIYVVDVEETQKAVNKEARVLALRGTPSKHIQDLEMAPGWHRLPNGIVAYSDPIAISLADPRGQIEDKWKARLTLVKDNDGMWTQLENEENFMSLGEAAFRKIGLGGPVRTITFFAPSRMEDYWEPDSEVPKKPFPEEKNKEPDKRLDWSEDDREEEEELELQMEARDIEKMVVAERPNEVELDEVVYTDKMTVKELQLACKERELPYSGSKKRLLDRLMAFRINLENQMKLSIANKLFEETQRRPLTLGQPKLPSKKDQEAHFVTHIPYAAWCQACVASRAKEDHYTSREEKEDLGKNLIQLDFCFTYTGEEKRMDEAPMDKVAERSDQFGTCLVMTSSETKAVHTVPIPSKGTASLKTITEEVIRFSLENSGRDPCIFQGDSERSMRQILRSVQQVRAVMGLQCEIRLTGSGQHASNGQVERAVQSMRKLANCIRSFAEGKAFIKIMGSLHMYPWSFKYASFLINRFRVLEKIGKTSYELATGHAYRGKLALYGETVMFKRLTKYKASDTFDTGIWVGKHSWNDNHIILTPEGAFEARTIRRLAVEDSFKGTDMIIAKGLPWSYSPQGIMMKHGGSAQRYRQPTLENEATEEEMKAITEAVAAGVVTPAPGLKPQPTTPGISAAAPVTPAIGRETPRKRSAEDAPEEPEAKRHDEEDSPRRSHEKRETQHEEHGEKDKKQRIEESEEEEIGGTPGMASTRAREVEEDKITSASPSKIPRLYPPHYAGIQAIEAHGDEEMDDNLIPEELTEDLFAGYGGNEDDEPPITTEAHLERLDHEARLNEVNRMINIPAMVECDPGEVEREGGYIISTKFVLTWKHRLEQGGWFRRARLVARQFKSSVNIEQTFAPTSMLVVPKMLIHLLLNVCREFTAMTLDIKDAFLMADQPKEEKAYVDVDGVIYRLVKCLPGQRTAASQWFHLFAKTAREFGLEQDVMQPTLLMRTRDIYITVHVDDVFMVGKEKSLRSFVNYLKEKMKWSIEEKGPFRSGETFHYLKREFVLYNEWCDIRCDYRQYESLAKDVDAHTKAYRKTPTSQEFSQKDETEELQGEDITRYRSVVGRLMYLAGERPDAQFAIQSLAKFMAKPTRQAWKNAWHVCSYLQGTQGFGVRIATRARGQTIMDVRDAEEVEDREKHLLEVVRDSDYAGNRNDRKSTSSFQILLDGNLMESRVRSQKSISLSSGEAEFVSMVGGSSDGLLIRHLWMKMTNEPVEMKIRSDSSAARSMVQRQGIGRVRHMDAALLWIQQKEKEKILAVSPIPTELNPADIGTKGLTRNRLFGLLYMIKMIDGAGDRVGQEEYKELEHRERMRKGTQKVLKNKNLHVGLIWLLSNLESVAGAPTTEADDEEGDSWKWIWLICVIVGALSLIEWLRHYMVMKVISMVWNYVGNIFNAATKEIMKYKDEKKGMDEKSTQVDNGVDAEALAQYESERNEVEKKIFQLDTYIEELEDEMSKVKEQRNMALQECLLAANHGKRLMERSLKYRICRQGMKIHFSEECPHFRRAESLEYCVRCLCGEGVSEDRHVPPTQA